MNKKVNELVNKLNTVKEGEMNMNKKVNELVKVTVEGEMNMNVTMKEMVGTEVVNGVKAVIKEGNVAEYNAKRTKLKDVKEAIKVAADKKAQAGLAVKEARKVAKANIADLNVLLSKAVAESKAKFVANEDGAVDTVTEDIKKAAANYAMAYMRTFKEENGMIPAAEFMNMDVLSQFEYLATKGMLNKYNNMRNIEFAKRSGASEELTTSMINKLADFSNMFASKKAGVKKLKRYSKELTVVYSRQVELFPVKNLDKSLSLGETVNVMSGQESDLTRAAISGTYKFADANFASKQLGSEEIISLKLSGIVNDEDARKRFLNGIFRKLSDNQDSKVGLFLVINKNGFAKLTWALPTADKNDKNYLATGAKCYRYAFLDISPSGYRSCSLNLAAIQSVENVNGEIVVKNCDRREEILNAATYDALRLTYKTVDAQGNEIWTEMDRLKAFKESSRLANGNAPSKVSFTVNNAIVFENIAEKACYELNNESKSAHKSNASNVINCEDTKDGTVFAAAESLAAFLNEQGEPIADYVVDGSCFQTRGIGTLKSSMQFMRRRNVSYLVKYLMETNCKINYVIYNGEKKDIADLSKEQLADLIANVDVCADRNAIKLDHHKDNVNVTILKMAYESNTKLSQILNIAMAHADLDATLELLKRRFTMLVADAFKQVGVRYEIDENGAITNTTFDPNSIKKISNSTQLMEHLLNSDPTKTIAAFPYAVRHIMANNIESLANRLTALDIPCDAKYTVVQADPGALFGVRILGLNEFYCGDKDVTVEATAAIRQPMSGVSAISIFKRVSLNTILERILATDLDVSAKEWLADYFRNLYGFNVIPASHYLMEKHDGMDFDIDAMMFYYDEEVVAICAKSDEFGTKIVRTEDDYRLTEVEEMLERWIDGKGFLQRVESVDTIAKATNIEANGAIKITSAAKKRKSTKKSVTVAFNSVAELVKEVFSNPIASVGVITSGFYNNALLLLCLLNDTETNTICNVLANEYDCNPTTGVDYVSPINKTVNELGYTELVLTKDVACEVILRFHESKGSLEDCLAFIMDCCVCNRYPAETSIDAAKNNYKMLDYFNHRSLVRCLGMDKHMSFNTVPANSNAKVSVLGGEFKDSDVLLSDLNAELYTKAATELDMPEATPFLNIPMITRVRKLKEAVGIEDSIAKLKLSLCASINQLILLAEAEIADFVESEEAAEIRSEIIAAYEEGENTYSKSLDDVNRIMKNIQSAYANLTLTLKENNVEEFVGLDADYEELTRKEAITSIGVSSIRNYAKVAFNNMSATDMGVLIAINYVQQLELSLDKGTGVTTINPGLTKVMEEEFVAGLSYLGFEDVDMIGEKLESIIDVTNNKYVSLDAIEGEFIQVEDGHAYVCVDGIDYDVRTSCKKGNIEGFVEIIDGHAYVISEKTMVVAPSNAMTLSAFDPCTNYDVNSICNAAVSYKFVARHGAISNVLVAVLANGSEIALCRLSLSEFSKKYIQAASDLGLLNPETVSCFTHESKDSEGNTYENVSVTIHDILALDTEIRTKITSSNKNKGNKRTPKRNLAADMANGTVKTGSSKFKAPGSVVLGESGKLTVGTSTESKEATTTVGQSGEVVSLGSAPSFRRAQ